MNDEFSQSLHLLHTLGLQLLLSEVGVKRCAVQHYTEYDSRQLARLLQLVVVFCQYTSFPLAKDPCMHLAPE